MTNVVSSAHQTYRSTRLTAVDEKGNEAWLQYLEPEEGRRWAEVIRADEALQRSEQWRPQPPFSRAYASGRPGPSMHAGSSSASAAAAASASASASAAAEDSAANSRKRKFGQYSRVRASPFLCLNSLSVVLLTSDGESESGSGGAGSEASGDKKLQTGGGSGSAGSPSRDERERERISEKIATTFRMLLTQSIEHVAKQPDASAGADAKSRSAPSQAGMCFSSRTIHMSLALNLARSPLLLVTCV